MLTVDEVVDVTGLSRMNVYNRIRSGQFLLRSRSVAAASSESPILRRGSTATRTLAEKSRHSAAPRDGGPRDDSSNNADIVEATPRVPQR